MNKQAAELNKQKSSKTTGDFKQINHSEIKSTDDGTHSSGKDDTDQLVQKCALKFEKKCPVYSSSSVASPGTDGPDADHSKDPPPSP